MNILITEEDFLYISHLMKSKYGIDLSRKKEIIQGRTENYIRAKGLRNYSEYIRMLDRDESGVLEKELVNMLTTNHTYFMREFEHFDFLKREVLPKLKQTEDATKDLRIWCGAASTGQEPYMLAMLLKDFLGFEHEKWDTKILATDISSEALSYAAAGIYTVEQVENLPEVWKRRFLQSIDGGQRYMMSDDIKKEVLFRHFNLMDNFPFRRKMHIVFLRNVMIYFDKETKQKLVQKVYDAMEPGGYLFVGTTETIDRDVTPFELVQPSIFRK